MGPEIIVAKLRKRETASFRNPQNGEKMECTVEAQVWPVEPESFPKRAPKHSYGWRQPAFVAQLIDWDGEKKVRFTYWLRKAGQGPNDWYFGGQYSPLMSLREYRAMMKKLNREKW